MSVSITGFDALMKSIKQAPDQLTRATIQKAQKLAEQVAGQARDGAPSNEGRLRNSIQSFVEVKGDVIEGGARTSYPPAVYHEFGTGYVGDEQNHPLAGELGVTHSHPVTTVRRKDGKTYDVDGWFYWSEEAAAKREPLPDGEPNGYVFTRGVPAKAFMYNAMKASEDQIMASLEAVVTEVFK